MFAYDFFCFQRAQLHHKGLPYNLVINCMVCPYGCLMQVVDHPITEGEELCDVGGADPVELIHLVQEGLVHQHPGKLPPFHEPHQEEVQLTVLEREMATRHSSTHVRM